MFEGTNTQISPLPFRLEVFTVKKRRLSRSNLLSDISMVLNSDIACLFKHNYSFCISSREHIIKRLLQILKRICSRDHLLEQQTSLVVQLDNLWKVDLRTALSVERIYIHFIPFKKIHVDGDLLFDAADLDSSSGVANH